MEFIPPNNVRAEQAVLCAMLMDAGVAVRISEELRAEEFYREAHRVIYRVILEMLDKKQVLDMITLCEALKVKGVLKDVGDYGYVMQLDSVLPTTAGWEEYVRIIHECSVKRMLANLGKSMAMRTQGEEAADSQVEMALEGVMQIATGNKEAGFEDAQTLVERTMESIVQRMDSGEYYLGVPTGFEALDDLTSGLQAGDFVILAARPSMGKTAMALNLVQGIVTQLVGEEHKYTVGFFSLEMSSEQLISRMLASMANVEGQKLNRGKLDNFEWDYVYDAANKLAETKLYIDDSSNINLRTMRSRARRLQAEQGLDVIFVDYLQLLPSPDSRAVNRHEEITMISRQLKALAKELRVPVIALSQLSRAVEGRLNKRPCLSDIRDSGAIEQDADVVAFLYRDEYYYPDTTKEPHICELNVAKHRNGPTGTVKYYFESSKNQFFEVE